MDGVELTVTGSRFAEYDAVSRLNRLLFDEDRITNRYDHAVMLTVLASAGGQPVGFKIGYGLDETTFYSAKGGVLPAWRRQGIARAMLMLMMETAARSGFTRFAYDTFPNLYRPMLILGLQEGFQVEHVEFNAQYNDWRMRLVRPIGLPVGPE